MRVHVKDGTAIESGSKCSSCTHAHIIRGFRESEELSFCDYASDLIRIPFKVKDCSNYRDRTSPDWEQMEKLAIDVRPSVRYAKSAGFQVAGDTEEDEAVAEAEVVSTER
jgi:hypothetical protein